MKRLTLCIVLVCMLAISASIADLHCAIAQPSSATLILACSASRLERP